MLLEVIIVYSSTSVVLVVKYREITVVVPVACVVSNEVVANGLNIVEVRVDVYAETVDVIQVVSSIVVFMLVVAE